MIIKCPECGRQVSEKAPTCPSCGVEIAGKITRCKHCGEVYFTEDGICPACNEPNTATPRPAQTVNVQPAVTTPYSVTNNTDTTRPVAQPKANSESNPDGTTNNGTDKAAQQPKKSKSYATLIAAFIFAVIVCGALFYFYNRAQSDKEMEDYEFALRSTDPDVMQQYLLRYADAPAAHRDSIQAHLLLIQKSDEEWQNAVLSNSRNALQQYIDNNPQSIHRQEALNKIDSLDWINASKSEDQKLVEEYISMHSDGKYVDDANVLLAKIKRATVQPDEKIKITALFRQFFQSINSRNESSLLSTVGMVIDNFLGKSNATGEDVLQFMHKIYKDDITNMNWRIDNDSYKVDKREVSEDEYEYTVTFGAVKEVDKGGTITTENYRINATVSTEGKISGFSLTKLN